MKRFLNGKMRMLSLLLSLVLAVGLIQANAVTASAAGPFSFRYAYDCQRDPAFPKKDGQFKAYFFQTPLDSSGEHISEPLHTPHSWTLTSLGKYADLSDPTSLSSIVSSVASNYQVSANDIEIFQLTMDGSNIARGVIVAQSPEVTAFFGDNLSSSGGGYLFSNSKLSDPTNVQVRNDVSNGSNALQQPDTPQHTHSWQITGDNTDTLTATCKGQGTCDAGGPVSVSISASSVTLPSSPFNAKVSNAQQFEAVTHFEVQPLDTLQRPGYKFKAAGASSFTDPDMNNPQAGTYQAIIYVKDASGAQHSAFVEYHAIDPVQTAATGDNRPIEMMVMGMACFSILAIAAFVLDGKRKACR